MIHPCATARYFYDAWGNVTNITGINDHNGYSLSSPNHAANINPFRYRGYYLDSETGLYYLQSRYYDPGTGRYINADSVIAGVGGLQGYNLFAYCQNNPVNLSDESGHWPSWATKAANWVNNNVIKPVVNFFKPSTNTVSGSFQDGAFQGSGSVTGGYSEFNFRLQDTSKNSETQDKWLGGFAKVSGANANGKVGIGKEGITTSVKGVGDALTASAQAGLHYDGNLGVGVKAKAAVLSGRASIEMQISGWQIELGVSGDILSVGAEATIGLFPEDGFKISTHYGAGIVGGGFLFRIKAPD